MCSELTRGEGKNFGASGDRYRYKFSRVISALLNLSLGSEEGREEKKKEGEKGRGGRESRLDRADASGTSVFA